MLPEVSLHRISGHDAWDETDRLLASPLTVRDGQIRQALIVDDRDRVTADLHLGNDDGDFLLYGEDLPEAGVREELRCVSINGPFAWELLARLEGQDLAGFTYLSFYRPRSGSIYFRAGKTGEFGYDLFVPEGEAGALYQRLLDAGEAFGARPVSREALALAALENGFFNARREGRFGLTAFELQLSCRVSFKKREWRPPERRIAYFSTEHHLAEGDEILLEGERIGSVLVIDRSPLLERFIGIALLDLRWSHSGLCYDAQHEGRTVPLFTTSAPFINNLSTFVKPGRDSFARRDTIAFPGWKRASR
jgi:glycine cleavage system aminomethyltransferase T